MKAFTPVLACLALAACGSGNDRAENTADQLEEAAEQSDPAAANVLENAAEQVRETGSPAAATGALEKAGNAQTPSMPNANSEAGAKPHGANEAVPPPQSQSAPPR